MCVLVWASEMDSLWPGHFNSLPDWLQLSGNVTGEPEQDLIAIGELPPSSRGQRATSTSVWTPNRYSSGQTGSYSSLRCSSVCESVCFCGLEEEGVPQDETLRASLLQHHVISSFCWGEDVRWQRGAQTTCGAQVQLTHLREEETCNRSRHGIRALCNDTYTGWATQRIKFQQNCETMLAITFRVSLYVSQSLNRCALPCNPTQSG